MGILDYFKKSEPDYDATNIQVTDLDVGFVFDYDLNTWEVKEVYEYDWGDNFFTVEFKVDNGSEIAYLGVEDDDELEISMSSKVKIRSVDADLPEYIMDNEKPPKKIEYKGMNFLLDGESAGYYRRADSGSQAWTEFISWTYYDEEEEYILTIEQWGEDEFEATFGKILKEYQISNILPKS